MEKRVKGGTKGKREFWVTDNEEKAERSMIGVRPGLIGSQGVQSRHKVEHTANQNRTEKVQSEL